MMRKQSRKSRMLTDYRRRRRHVKQRHRKQQGKNHSHNGIRRLRNYLPQNELNQKANDSENNYCPYGGNGAPHKNIGKTETYQRPERNRNDR